jgi:hypothetical protein
LLKIFSKNDLLLKTIAMIVIDTFHQPIDVESQIDVMSENIFTLGDVHCSKFGYVSFKFINSLGSILLFDDILDLLTFLREYTLKGIKVLIPNFLEN